MPFLRIVARSGLRSYIDKAAPGVRLMVQMVVAHKAIAIFTVIALEEIGVPLPLPGDVFIAYAGHLVARHRIGIATAFLTIVLGSIVGASVLYYIARRYGKPFVHKYGPYIHIKQKRLEMVERWFVRHGPLVIVLGRQIPGFRMVISVFAGVFGVSYPVFLGSVAVAASIWAGMFLAIGYKLDRHLGPYMTITPLHLLPSTLFLSFSIIYGFVLKHRAVRDENRLLALQDTEASS
jgi:membrane protein DedA with SNARE-associated domain